MAKKPAAAAKTVATITHPADKRKNIPTAEYQSVVQQEQQRPVPVKYPRNTDLDPQLVWRGEGRTGLVRSGRQRSAASISRKKYTRRC